MPRNGKDCHNDVIRVPGAHCKIDDCHEVGSICCDLVQDNWCEKKPAPHHECHYKKIQVVPESIVLEPHCLDVSVCLKPTFTPGKVDVYNGDVYIEQEIEVEVFKQHVRGCKPKINIKCKDQKKKVCPPRVVHHEGKVRFKPKFTIKCGEECNRPSGGINPCKDKDCDKKRPYHKDGDKRRK